MVTHNEPDETDSRSYELSDKQLSGPVINRRTTLSLLSAAGLTSLAGCAGGNGGSQETSGNDGSSEASANDSKQNATESEKVNTGGKLSVGWRIGSIDKLDPPYISDQKVFPVMANIFNGLVELKKDLTIQGDLAKDWEVTNNGSTFTFDLRKGVKFHNNTKFTSNDVKYTINRTISKDTPAASKLSTLKPVNKGGVIIKNDHRVQINFKESMAPALVYLTRGPGRAATIVNKEAIEKMGQKKYNLSPIGTGPFKVTKHNLGSTLNLKRFDDYFKTDDNGVQIPYLDEIEIKPIPESSTIVNAIQSGDIDFMDSVPLSNSKQLEQSNEVEQVSAPGVNFTGLAMNNKREPFTSQKVRLAIAKLIDNKQLVKSAFFGNGLPDTGPINKGTKWVWRDNKPNDQDYNAERGKEILKTEGAEGSSFSIMATEGNLRSSKVVRQQLTKAGLNIDIEQVTSSTFSDNLDKKDFDATLIGSGGDPDPDQSLYNFFTLPNKDGVWNYMNYKSKKVNDLLIRQRRELDREKRKQTLQEIEDQLISDAPFAFLYHEDDISANRSFVKGYTPISGLRYFDTVWLNNK